LLELLIEEGTEYLALLEICMLQRVREDKGSLFSHNLIPQ